MIALAILTPFVCFVLPFFVRTPPALSVSASFDAGFNNSVAIYGTAVLSVLMLCLAWWRHAGEPALVEHVPQQRTIPKSLVAGLLVLTAAVQSFAGYVVIASRERSLGDAGYIIEQATVRATTGRALYSQIEFAYGPLLLLPEIWLHRLLGITISQAYFALLVLQSALGLLMLVYLLNAFPMRSGLRNAALVCLALAAITPHLGLNYTLFRFASPFFVLLWSTRSRSPFACAAWLGSGVVLEFLISPELGLALAVGVLVFGIARALQRGWHWLLVALLPLAVLVLVLATIGRPYLRMASVFTSGAMNLPVGPYPHVLLLLVAAVWLVPRMLGRCVDLRSDQSAVLLAFYALSLAFLPAALGRCDPLHVMFNGTGWWVLVLTAFNTGRPRAGVAWILALALVVLQDHRVNERYFQFQDLVMLRKAILDKLPAAQQDRIAHALAHHNAFREYVLSSHAESEHPVDMAVLKQFVGDAPVATPMEISPALEDQLRAAHLYDPGFFAFWVDTMNGKTEQQEINFANAHEWMLLPASWRHGGLQLPQGAGGFQGLNLHYKLRKPLLYCPGETFNADLRQHWTLVWSFGTYLLYRHTDHTSGVDRTDLDWDCDQPDW